MSEAERPSEETKTELMPKETPPQTLEISEATRAESMPPAPGDSEATEEQSRSATPTASQSLPLPPPPTPAPPSAAPAPYPPTSYESYSQQPPPPPPTAAFVPPELLARRRAAAPPSQPYQPIAGWSLAPAQPMDPSAAPTGAFAQPQAGPVSPQTQANWVQAPPTGPANGFASPPTGAIGPPGPASGAPGARVPIVPRAGADDALPRRGPFLLAVVALVAVLVVAGLLYMKKHNPTDDTATPSVTASAAPTKAPVAAKFTVSSYDPRPGGEGFRSKGDYWDTNTYNDATFGGLKAGVGLVLDLGEAKQVTSVTFNTAKTGPLTVELRSADKKPSGSSAGTRVGKASQASDEATLDGSKGGKHQYWMIWVTKLGPERKAVISDISVSAS